MPPLSGQLQADWPLESLHWWQSTISRNLLLNYKRKSKIHVWFFHRRFNSDIVIGQTWRIQICMTNLCLFMCAGVCVCVCVCVCERECVSVLEEFCKQDSSFLSFCDGNFSFAFTVIWIILLKQIWLHINFERYSNSLGDNLPSHTEVLCSLVELITGPWSSSLTGCGKTQPFLFFLFFIIPSPPHPKRSFFDYSVIWASFCHFNFIQCV